MGAMTRGWCSHESKTVPREKLGLREDEKLLSARRWETVGASPLRTRRNPNRSQFAAWLSRVCDRSRLPIAKKTETQIGVEAVAGAT